MAAPAPVITCAFQLVGQKIILPFGSDISPLLKFHWQKYLPWSWQTWGWWVHRRAGEYDPTIKHSWWVTRATTFHSCPCNSFFFGSPHTAFSLFWPADMDMDEVIRVEMAQPVQIWRKWERKEDKKYKNAKSIWKYAYNHNFAIIQFRYTCGWWINLLNEK